MELISYLWQYLVEGFGLIIAYVFAAIFIILVLRQFHSWKITAALAAIFIGVSIAFFLPNGVPTAMAYPIVLDSYGPGEAPNLPVRNVFHFFQNFDNFERIEEIARMLGGIDITSKAREHAAEMLRSGSTQKKKATRK